VRTAQYITGAKLPAIQDLYTRRYQRKAQNNGHPSYRLFSLLQHGKWSRSTKSRSKKLLNSFYPLCFYTTAICCLSSMHSHFTPTYMYKLP
jgi:hypothetical protein